MPEVIVQQSAVHHVPEDSNASWLTQRVSCRDTKKTQTDVIQTDSKQPAAARHRRRKKEMIEQE